LAHKLGIDFGRDRFIVRGQQQPDRFMQQSAIRGVLLGSKHPYRPEDGIINMGRQQSFAFPAWANMHRDIKLSSYAAKAISRLNSSDKRHAFCRFIRPVRQQHALQPSKSAVIPKRL
jgi:hypothetical protein